MKYMNTGQGNKINKFTAKKKKHFSNNHINRNHKHSKFPNAVFSRIFQSTTILSRSPSHSFNHSPNMISHGNYQKNAVNYQGPKQCKNGNNQTGNFKKFSNYKKSKSIKISNNNTNKGNFTTHHQNQGQKYSNNNFNSAANHLANMLHSELTINLTKHEPRMVLYNNTSYNQQVNQNQQLINSSNISRPKFFKHAKKQAKNASNHAHQAMSQSVGSPPSVSQRYQNRFKYIKPANLRYRAPYNTTQYIMYDYSKRRGNELECPNVEQQFSDDWNMALTQGTTSATESLNITANNINNSIINNNTFISLSKNDEAKIISTSLGSGIGSNHISDLDIPNNNIPADNFHQLSSSL